ncbi:MAG: hypothetical protein WD738_09705 [Pirellulales bacterium]
MGRVSDTVGTINSTLRTLLMLVLVGGAGYGGYKAYDLYNEPRQQLADKQAELETARESLKKANSDLVARQQEIEKLGTELADKTAQVERLEIAMRLLKVRRRLARLTVLDQRELPQDQSVAAAEPGDGEGESSPNLVSRIEFVEVNDRGDPIGEAKQFNIIGDMVYIDYLRVTFDDKYIEESDLDRSTAIALFQRIFGEHQEAVEGFQLDTVGTRPTAYARGTEMSDYERKIWDDFWLIANDRQRAAELGIHAAHGSAVSMRVRPGMTYEVELRATGDMTMRPVEASATATQPEN